MERELVPLEICQRKFLTGESTGILIQGIQPQLKLIQTITATASFALNSDQANSAELIGARHHLDDRNHCSQGESTPRGMELDDIQEGICPRM